MDLYEYAASAAQSFREKPLTEADSAVFAALANIDLSWFHGQDGRKRVPLGDLARAFLEKCCGGEEAPSRECRFLEALAGSPRYSPVGVENPVYKLDVAGNKQFGALVFFPEDDFAYLGYAGTGTSITGFKEDFLLCADGLMPSYEEAVRYANSAELPECFAAGGFSKGGNLAVFASAFCRKDVQDRITGVYSHDGPGFPDLVAGERRYREILPRVKSYVPEASLVGLCLGGIEGYEVIRSKAPPVFQHEPYSWLFEGDRFVRADGLSLLSRQFLKAQERLLAQVPEEDRGEMVEALFFLFRCTGSDDFRDFFSKGFKIMPELSQAWKGAGKETRRAVLRLAASLFDAVFGAGRG